MPGGPRQLIPEDIRVTVAELLPQAARQHYTVAMAIVAERERCIAIVEKHDPDGTMVEAIRNAPIRSIAA